MTTFEDRARAMFEHEQAIREGPTSRHASSLIDWLTFWDTTHNDDDWLVEPFLARGRQHALYALAKAGKSLLMLDVAARIATGRSVLDRAAGDPEHVCYFDLEMTEDDVRERLLDMGYGPDVDMSHLHYHSLPSLSPLDTADGGHEVEEMAMDYKASLVVVDTVGRTITGDENDANTMQSFYRYTGQPLKQRGIALARADHAGKDVLKGQRGSSAKNDDVDIVWQLTPRDDRSLDLRATHRRMGWVPPELHLKMEADPLRHVLAIGTVPEGTRACADLLDELGCPIGISNRSARSVLRDGHHPMGNDTLAAALRYRRNRPVNPSDLGL